MLLIVKFMPVAWAWCEFVVFGEKKLHTHHTHTQKGKNWMLSEWVSSVCMGCETILAFYLHLIIMHSHCVSACMCEYICFSNSCLYYKATLNMLAAMCADDVRLKYSNCSFWYSRMPQFYAVQKKNTMLGKLRAFAVIFSDAESFGSTQILSALTKLSQPKIDVNLWFILGRRPKSNEQKLCHNQRCWLSRVFSLRFVFRQITLHVCVCGTCILAVCV